MYQAAPGVPGWRCSGALLSSTVVLTAGHCTDGAVAACIWLQDDVTHNAVPYPLYPFGGLGSGAYEGVAYTNPDYRSPDNPYGGGNGLPAYSYRDVGIVVLSEPVPTSVVSAYAQLPTPNFVDSLASGTAVDLVGYGVQYQISGKGGISPRDRWAGPRIRMYAPTRFVSGEFIHSPEYLRLTANPGQDKGGTCFGDSGGSDFLGGTNIALGVNSYVTNSNCAGVTYSARVEVPVVLEWIESFLE